MVLGPPPTTSQRRSSILPFRPSTSPGVPPPPPSTLSQTFSHPAAIPALPRTPSVDALRRLANDFPLKHHNSDRWSLLVQPHTHPDLEERQFIFPEASHHCASTSTSTSSGGPSLLSLGKSLVRRASTTLNGPGKSRKGSKDRIELPLSVSERPVTARTDITSAPAPPQSRHSTSKRASLLRRMRSYARPRRDAFSTASGETAVDCALSYYQPSLPAQLRGHQIHQFDWPRPGAAARASAAAAASATSMHLVGRPGTLARKDTKFPRASDSMDLDLPYTTIKMDSTMEVDSVIGDFNGRDPFTALPPELATMILSTLDHKSLCRASQVSKGWLALASRENGSLWREVFYNRFEPRHAAPQQMGGAGIGRSDCDTRNWKTKYAARQLIERNWRNGTPEAIYFQGHTDSVYCAQFDEHKIITGSRDRTIRVWDINTYECLKVIGGPAAKPVRPSLNEPPLDVHACTVHKGRNLNGTLEGDALYHIPSEYHSASVLCLRFDDEIMVTGSSDSTCIVWDIKTFEPIFRLLHHSAGVLDVCFDKRYIVSCSKDNSICIWSRKTGELVTILTGHRGPVNALQMRDSLLISASSDGVTKLWNLNEFKFVKSFTSRDRGLAAVEFSDDAKFVLAGGNDQVIHKYDVKSGNLVHTYAGHQGLVRSLFLDSENNRVVSGSYDQAVRVYDFQTGRGLGGDLAPPTATSPLSQSNSVTGIRTGAYENWTTSWILSAKSDYRRIVATSQDGRALLMDFGRGLSKECLELLKGG